MLSLNNAFDDAEVMNFDRRCREGLQQAHVVYAGELSKETFSGVVSAKSNLSQVLKILEEGGVAFKIEGRKIIVK
jgi:hypothetical protein